MDYSPAYILSRYLIDQSLLVEPGESGAWPVFVNQLPSGDLVDDDAVGCINTTPVKDGRVMGGLPLFHYGFQLLVRSSAHNTGYAKAEALADALGAVDDPQIVVGSSTYRIVNVTQTTGVVPLGQEEGTERRELFSINFLATIEEVA